MHKVFVIFNVIQNLLATGYIHNTQSTLYISYYKKLANRNAITLKVVLFYHLAQLKIIRQQ